MTLGFNLYWKSWKIRGSEYQRYPWLHSCRILSIFFRKNSIQLNYVYLKKPLANGLHLKSNFSSISNLQNFAAVYFNKEYKDIKILTVRYLKAMNYIKKTSSNI